MKRYMPNVITLTLLASLILSGTTSLQAAEPDWELLFDGKTLNGWIQRNGQAKYHVEDGAIVGTTVLNTPNSFLCTAKNYGDFILELEFKVAANMNSGIQIRSNSYRAYKNRRVHGYQIEIDPSARAWSGGIYDEARRGWLFDLKDKPAAQKAFKQDQWNHYRIDARGDRIRTWVNGVPAADLKDSLTASGFIALQVHGSKTANQQIRWRNIRIKNYDRHTPIKALIVDGQNNHRWQDTTPVLKNILEEEGIFSVAIATSPGKGQSFAGFKPDFGKYGVIVLNYAGDDWSGETRSAFEKYVRNGGGVVVYHAADNAFPQWEEFNKMIGLGGWGGRNEKSGPMVYMKDGKIIRDTSPGAGGSHGQQTDFKVTHQDKSHPITSGLPDVWMHVADELYNRMRGPAENMTILATGSQEPKYGGTGRDEPALFTIQYGKGRVFHTVLGHHVKQLTCVGFIETFQRGAEWAATGRVSLTAAVPDDFPTAEKVSLRGSVAQSAPKIDVSVIRSWDFNQSSAELAALEETFRSISPTQLAKVEKQLLPILQDAQATYAGKAFVCRLLRRIGTDQSVGVLAGLLPDEKLSHMARFALQHMTGARAGEALLQNLNKVSNKLKVGIIGSLGARGEQKAVAAITSYLNHSDSDLAHAAINTLGHIGTLEAAQALAGTRVSRALQPLRDDAYLRCADALLSHGQTGAAGKIYREMSAASRPVMIRIVAFEGMARAEKENAVPALLALLKDGERKLSQAAGKILQDIPGRNATGKIASQLTRLPKSTQVLVLNTLAARGDKTAAPDVTRLLQSSDQRVQRAAIGAMAVLGDASVVEPLGRLTVVAGENGRAARDSLTRLAGPGISEALVKAIAKSTQPAVRANLIDAAVSRRDSAALPTILQAVQYHDPAVRRAAYKALGALAGEKELPKIVAKLVTVQNSQEREELERTLISIAVRNPGLSAQPIIDALARASDEAKINLLSVLSRLGGDSALTAVRRQLNTSNANLKKAAIRALANWPDTSCQADLLKLARSESVLTNHVLALRGYVKMAGESDQLPPAELQKRFKAAMDAARRTEEKKLILSTVAGKPALWSLEFTKQYSNDPAIQNEARTAYQDIFAVINKMTVIDSQGVLKAKEAEIHGSGAAYEPASNRDCIGVWNNVNAWVSWKALFKQGGTYTVIASQSMAGQADSQYEVEIAGQKLLGVVKSSGDWARFIPVDLGKITISEPGTYTISVKPKKIAKDYVMNLRSITLKRNP